MRMIVTLGVRLILTLALLYFALHGVDFSSLMSRLGDADFRWLAAAVGAALLQIALASIRWRRIATQCGAPIGLAQTTRFNLIAAFFNQTLPSTIGGDAMRVWLVQRAGAGADLRAAAYSVLVDRVIGLLALAVLVVASLPWCYRIVADPSGRIGLLVVDAAAIAGGVGFLLFVHLHWPWLKRLWPFHHIETCAAIANRVLFDSRSGPRVAILSILVHLLSVVMVWFAARAIAAPVDFIQTFLLVPPVLLISILPITIAGWGLREATMMVAFGYAGLAPADGTTISVLFGGVSFLVGAVGGVVWVAHHRPGARVAAAAGRTAG